MFYDKINVNVNVNVTKYKIVIRNVKLYVKDKLKH